MPYDSVVKYPSNYIIPDAVYRWILLLHKYSWIKRFWDDIKDRFSFRRTNRNMSKLLALQDRVQELDYKMQLFGRELEKYKSLELFESLKDHGDPFPLLYELYPDEENLPFRYCVVDMAGEFCKYHSQEEYCQMLNQCRQDYLYSQVCRPKECPFRNKLGCKVVSTCMQPSVIEQYKKALATRGEL